MVLITDEKQTARATGNSKLPLIAIQIVLFALCVAAAVAGCAR